MRSSPAARLSLAWLIVCALTAAATDELLRRLGAAGQQTAQAAAIAGRAPRAATRQAMGLPE